MKKVFANLLWIFILSLKVVATHAQSPIEGGRVLHSQFARAKKPFSAAPLQSRSLAMLDASWKLDENLDVKLTPWFFWTYANDLNGPTKVATLSTQLQRGYIRNSGEGWEVRVGRDVVSWGVSDAINPTDYLGVKDQTFLTFQDENKRRGLNLIRAKWTADEGRSPVSLEFVLAGQAPRTDVLEPEQTLPSSVKDWGVRSSQKGDFGSNLAIRAQYTGEGWEGSISGYTGQSALPEYQLLESSLLSIGVGRQHQRMTAVGFDGTSSHQKWIFRWEAAHRRFSLSDGRAEILQQPTLDTVVGVERPLGERFRVHGQILHKWINDWKDPKSLSGSSATETSVLRALAEANQRLWGSTSASSLGSTLRLTYKTESEDWTVQTFHLYLFESQSAIHRPSLTHTPITNLNVTLGAELLDGPLDTGLGSLRDLSSLFAELEFVF